MQTTSLIGRRCKCSNAFSWPILIDRKLELLCSSKLLGSSFTHFFFIRFFNGHFRMPQKGYAPLAQLVEQLTLNQWVRGSSPRRCTTRHGSGAEKANIFKCCGSTLSKELSNQSSTNSNIAPTGTVVGVFIAQGPPVPIPNTEVKLCGAEDTCLATSWENRSMPTPRWASGGKKLSKMLKAKLNTRES